MRVIFSELHHWLLAAMATKICFYPEKNWKGEKPNFTVSLTLLVSVPPTATGLSLVQLLLEPNAFPPTYSQLHRNLEEWTLAVRLPHSVFCCVCCVAICILYWWWLSQSWISISTRHTQDHGVKPRTVLWKVPSAGFYLLIQKPWLVLSDKVSRFESKGFLP